MSNPLYWIGIRESEIADTGTLFSGSITIFGSGRQGNRSFEKETSLRYDYNQDNPVWERFAAEQIHEIVQTKPDSRFMLYAADEAKYYGPEAESRTLCRNPQSLTELLSDKFQTRQWLSEYVPILPYVMQYGAAVKYEDLKRSFPEASDFIVQRSSSCGGSGTWLLTETSQARLSERLNPAALYAVTPYKKHNISPNIHLIISSDQIQLLPPSIQIIKPDAHGLSYKGADFPAYALLPSETDRRLREYAVRIGTVLRRAGYRGVCGIDFLIADGEVYLMEINARFQSSTFLLNRAMAEAGCGTSVQALHLRACEGRNVSGSFETLRVPYSFYHYTYAPARREQLRYLHALMKRNEGTDCVDDDLDWEMRLESNTYVFKAVYRGAITAPDPEGGCRLHANIGLLAENASPERLSRDPEMMKLLLLSHGVRLSEGARRRLMADGGFNHEEFAALDLVVNQRVYICAPYETNRSELSPFCVEEAPDQGFLLSVYGAGISNVVLRRANDIDGRRTAKGLLYRDIAYLGSDRLRVFHRCGCFFKDHAAGCRFCDIPEVPDSFSLEDIRSVLDAYRGHPEVRHYMIGGGSASPDDDFQRIIQIAKYIYDSTGKGIYLMSLPPENPEILWVLKEAGISEVSFNLEVYDRELARKYMPGKGAISFDVYQRAFQTAVEIWGKRGNVRSMFVVGLEPAESLLQGVAHVAEMGVSPILALFRPIPGTPLEYFLAPPDIEIQEICRNVKQICRRYNVEMGPQCPRCEDNTLKITL